MTKSQIRAGDDGLDQTPAPLVAGSFKLFRVRHWQETIAEATDEDALPGREGSSFIGSSSSSSDCGWTGFEGNERGERRVLEERALKRPVRGERRRRRRWSHGQPVVKL